MRARNLEVNRFVVVTANVSEIVETNVIQHVLMPIIERQRDEHADLAVVTATNLSCVERHLPLIVDQGLFPVLLDLSKKVEDDEVIIMHVLECASNLLNNEENTKAFLDCDWHERVCIWESTHKASVFFFCVFLN